MERDVTPTEAPRSRRLAFNEIDLMEVGRDIWGAKYFLLAMGAAGLLIAILALAVITPTYTATMTISQSEGAPRPSGLGQYAAAASAIGLSVGNSDDSSFTKYKVLLDSDILSTSLFQRDDMKARLFGPEWNPQTRTFSRPTGLVFNLKEFVKSILGLRTWSVPGPTAVRNVLKARMNFTADKLTGLVKISVDAGSPADAVYLLSAVSKQVDDLIRKSAKQRSAGRIEYLNAALARTTVQDQREAMINILGTEQRNMMMASVDKTFAMDIIDPPSAASDPTAPVPRVTLVTYILMMVVIGIFIAIFHGQKMRARTLRAGDTAQTLDMAMRNLRSSLWRRRSQPV